MIGGCGWGWDRIGVREEEKEKFRSCVYLYG